MATILSFRAAERGSSMKAQHASLIGCEIVLFPGVRYEYHAPKHEPDFDTAKPKRKTARKRDKLELKD